jgi:hypothetical protein
MKIAVTAGHQQIVGRPDIAHQRRKLLGTVILQQLRRLQRGKRL